MPGKTAEGLEGNHRTSSYNEELGLRLDIRTKHAPKG